MSDSKFHVRHEYHDDEPNDYVIMMIKRFEEKAEERGYERGANTSNWQLLGVMVFGFAAGMLAGMVVFV